MTFLLGITMSLTSASILYTRASPDNIVSIKDKYNYWYALDRWHRGFHDSVLIALLA
jgi:hypothetical protein